MVLLQGGVVTWRGLLEGHGGTVMAGVPRGGLQSVGVQGRVWRAAVVTRGGFATEGVPDATDAQVTDLQEGEEQTEGAHHVHDDQEDGLLCRPVER